MTDWIDVLGDAIFGVADLFMGTGRPKRVIGISLIAITVFVVIGTLIAVWLGANLAPAGYIVLAPTLLVTTTVASYCLLTDRAR